MNTTKPSFNETYAKIKKLRERTGVQAVRIKRDYSMSPTRYGAKWWDVELSNGSSTQTLGYSREDAELEILSAMANVEYVRFIDNGTNTDLYHE